LPIDDLQQDRWELAMQSNLDQEKSINRALAAIEAIKSGRMVIMTDDEQRENEGDLVLAAEHVSAQAVNFMAKEARGLICLTLEPQQISQLNLPMMEDTSKPEGERGTAFTVSIEARHGVTTGISAHDRAQTILTAIKSDARPSDIVVPGHVFPLKARPGGVLQRAGHTEGSVDIARMAGLKPAAVICEIMNDDGTMARLPQLEKFAETHQLPIVTIADLVNLRLLRESLVENIHVGSVSTVAGDFRSYVFRNSVDGGEHFALVKGENFGEKIVDVRVHQQRPLVDVFSNRETGGRFKIEHALDILATSEAGVFLYLTTSKPNQNFAAEVREMSADKGASDQESGAGYLAAMDARQIGTGAQILRSLGVSKMRVHTASKRPLKGIVGFGLEIVENQIMDTNATH